TVRRAGGDLWQVRPGWTGDSVRPAAAARNLVPRRRRRRTVAPPARRSLVGAPAPSASSVARLLARWVSPPAASRTSWCSSFPGGTGLSSPLPGVIVFVGAPAPGANSVAIGLDG